MKPRQYSAAFGSFKKATFVTAKPVSKETFEFDLIKGFIQLADVKISRKQAIELAKWILKIAGEVEK